MLTKKFITAFATGALMLASLTPIASAETINTPDTTSPVSSLTSTVNGANQTLEGLLGGNSVTTNTTTNVTSNNGNTSANVANQTNADVLGNTVSTSTNLTTQLGL